jgi:transposase
MRRRPRYTEEFRAEAIRLARSRGADESIRQVAMRLGVSNETLGLWLRDADAVASATEAALNADERHELVDLRRRVKTLETERDILKKAAAFFAQESERTR